MNPKRKRNSNKSVVRHSDNKLVKSENLMKSVFTKRFTRQNSFTPN